MELVICSYSTKLDKHYENKGYSIGFAVNENLSVSFTEEDSQRNVSLKHKQQMLITRTDVDNGNPND